VTKIKDAIVERYYQKRAIGSIAQHFASGHRKVAAGDGDRHGQDAHGGGAGRSAAAGRLGEAGAVSRRPVALVRQAVNAFKKHLPESSPVNLVTEKDKSGRVYVCTYPTMMGLIDETSPARAGSKRASAWGISIW
jgi:type I restriction enzyme R subunit